MSLFHCVLDLVLNFQILTHTEPVTSPVAAPVTVPVASPVAAPIAAPVASPVAAPVSGNVTVTDSTCRLFSQNST